LVENSAANSVEYWVVSMAASWVDKKVSLWAA
jgi:hypothetical protein